MPDSLGMATLVRKVPEVGSRFVYVTASKAENGLPAGRDRGGRMFDWIQHLLREAKARTNPAGHDLVARDQARATIRKSGVYSFDVSSVMTHERMTLADEIASEARAGRPA